MHHREYHLPSEVHGAGPAVKGMGQQETHFVLQAPHSDAAVGPFRHFSTSDSGESGC